MKLSARNQFQGTVARITGKPGNGRGNSQGRIIGVRGGHHGRVRQEHGLEGERLCDDGHQGY